MPDLRRPDVAPPLFERMRVGARQRFESHNPASGTSSTRTEDEPQARRWPGAGIVDRSPEELLARAIGDTFDQDSGPRSPSHNKLIWGLVGVLAGVGLAAVGFFGFRAWSNRSSPPIDSALPMLIGTADEAGRESQSVEPGSPTSGLAQADPEQDDPKLISAAALEPGAPDESEPAERAPNERAPAESAQGARALGEGLVGPVEPTPVPMIVVHVSGAVSAPGIVELPADARTHHAVSEAGGATSNADLDRVNLAAPLLDGERIHIPAHGQSDVPPIVAPAGDRSMVTRTRPVPAATEVVPTPASSPIETRRRVDINSANANELETLPGVGPALAERIIGLRLARGPYASVDELELVDGIGPAKLESLRPMAVVGPAVTG